MSSLGERLAEERKRLNLDQEQFGEIGGVKRNAQLAYEKDRRPVNSDYLERVGAAGVDLFYLMTGDRIEDQPKADPEQFDDLLNNCVDILFEVQKELGVTFDAEMYKNALSFAFTSRATKSQMLKFASAIVASLNKG